MRKFYVVETEYVGPGMTDDQYIDSHVVEIWNTPALGNSSHEPIINGWCGTTNDWGTYAHGVYDTIEEAREVIESKFGPVRDHYSDGTPFESEDTDVVEIYKPGQYEPWGRMSTHDWAYESIDNDITADTTDNEISALMADYEQEANSQGYTLDEDELQRVMTQRRNEMRDLLDYEAELEDSP